MVRQRYIHIHLEAMLWARSNNADNNNIKTELFDLQLINSTLLGNFNEYMHGRDVEGALGLMSSQKRLEFVARNVYQLLFYGFFEQAIVSAYTGTKDNFHDYKLRDVKFLLNVADKDLLYDCGDMIDAEYPVVVYRGVAGSGHKYRPRGLSWTTDIEKAKWFAMYPENKFGIKLPNCHVYKTIIKKQHVYFYSNEREENEFVCNITPKHPVELIWSGD